MAEGQIDILSLGFEPSAAIGKYQAVKLIDADTVGPVTAEGDLWCGVAIFAVSTAEIAKGKLVTVRVLGMPLVKVGTGGVTVGNIGVIDATGQVVASNSGARPLGLIMATGVAGDYVPVLLTSPGLPVV